MTPSTGHSAQGTGWIPKVGDKVHVPSTTDPAKLSFTWWWGEVRTVQPPWVRVLVIKARRPVMLAFRIDQIRPREGAA